MVWYSGICLSYIGYIVFILLLGGFDKRTLFMTLPSGTKSLGLNEYLHMFFARPMSLIPIFQVSFNNIYAVLFRDLKGGCLEVKLMSF